MTFTRTLGALTVAGALTLAAGCTASSSPNSASSSSAGPSKSSTTSAVTVSITGGLDTVAGDNGRPIVLVAGLLGVPPAVFRQAFSGVTPANPADGPTDDEAQSNKAALLSVLSPYGITNEQLDTASNTYRYNQGGGESWPHTAATAVAVVEDGRVTSIKITNADSGYTSTPTVTLSNGQTATATVSYGQRASANGSISAITVT